MLDGGSSSEFLRKAEAAVKADSVNFSAYKRLYQDDDLETLQGVLREIAFSLKEITDKKSSRWQEQKQLQILAEEVMQEKEKNKQEVLEKLYRHKTKTELENLRDELRRQLPDLLSKSQRLFLSDEKKDRAGVVFRLKQTELAAVDALITKLEIPVSEQSEVKNISATAVAEAGGGIKAPAVENFDQPVFSDSEFEKKLAAKLAKNRVKLTASEFGSKSTIILPEVDDQRMSFASGVKDEVTTHSPEFQTGTQTASPAEIAVTAVAGGEDGVAVIDTATAAAAEAQVEAQKFPWKKIKIEAGKEQSGIFVINKQIKNLKPGGVLEFGTLSDGNSLKLERMANGKYRLVGIENWISKNKGEVSDLVFDQEENNTRSFKLSWSNGEYRNIHEWHQLKKGENTTTNVSTVAEAPGTPVVSEPVQNQAVVEQSVEPGGQGEQHGKSEAMADKLGIGALVREVTALKKENPDSPRLAELLEKGDEHFERFVSLSKDDIEKRIGPEKTDKKLNVEHATLLRKREEVAGQDGKEFKLFEIQAAIEAIAQILDERVERRRLRIEAAEAAVESTAAQTVEPASEPSTAVSENVVTSEPAQESGAVSNPETPAVVEAAQSPEDQWADFEQKVAVAKKKYAKKSLRALDKELERLKKLEENLSPQSDKEALLLNSAAQEAIGRLKVEKEEQAALAQEQSTEASGQDLEAEAAVSDKAIEAPEDNVDIETSLGEAGKIARQFFETGLAQATNEEGRARFEAYLEKVRQGDVISSIEFLGLDGQTKEADSIFEFFTYLANSKNSKGLKKQLKNQPEIIARINLQIEQAKKFLKALEKQARAEQSNEDE
ncbi:MAG: hypothetical protein UX09_C0003G0016 [Candidatus Uhrbacteria bacterium GW2011_GWE2_45_35]|uniref:Uncharacterized protein n=1 Tax=Candidatus Uhrbacteria bacterium GW2011_GWE2_45_35 TaxID=1618993 RepID=A0A0G1MM22_9BACT|nr:MAG: hypothetical protein UX09_C0003G0016 [Candidatus Uhrbacteria bacterium GW2011_GWE2_45_35]HCU32179.1 hypothetical protein [Candidatus Uhrbacteria bacterium]